jgi:flagellar assembly protein FliH
VHFTNLRVTIDDTLNPGDCLVRSRFGVTDARASAKIDALKHEVLGL